METEIELGMPEAQFLMGIITYMVADLPDKKIALTREQVEGRIEALNKEGRRICMFKTNETVFFQLATREESQQLTAQAIEMARAGGQH